MICEGTLEDWASMPAGFEMKKRAICLRKCSAYPRLQGDSVGDGHFAHSLKIRMEHSIRRAKDSSAVSLLVRRRQPPPAHDLQPQPRLDDSTTRGRSHSSLSLKSTAPRIRRKKNNAAAPHRH